MDDEACFDLLYSVSQITELQKLQDGSQKQDQLLGELEEEKARLSSLRKESQRLKSKKKDLEPRKIRGEIHKKILASELRIADLRNYQIKTSLVSSPSEPGSDRTERTSHHEGLTRKDVIVNRLKKKLDARKIVS
jgi:hypothetical protein